MMPVAPLMIEHRLIQRMIAVMGKHIQTVPSVSAIDLSLIDQGVDFLRTYADRCHHGKEEDILFATLRNKKLTDHETQILQELVDEHVLARKTVKALAAAVHDARNGNSQVFDEIAAIVRRISDIYPPHIEKEDKHFFIPVMKYYTAKEQDEMLRQFKDFDQHIIHDKYRNLVEDFEHNPVKAESPVGVDQPSEVYECSVCGYQYLAEVGDPDQHIPPGTPFSKLPDQWVCPVCGAGKDAFVKK